MLCPFPVQGNVAEVAIEKHVRPQSRLPGCNTAPEHREFSEKAELVAIICSARSTQLNHLLHPFRLEWRTWKERTMALWQAPDWLSTSSKNGRFESNSLIGVCHLPYPRWKEETCRHAETPLDAPL